MISGISITRIAGGKGVEAWQVGVNFEIKLVEYC
jgi:hypothetical protein